MKRILTFLALSTIGAMAFAQSNSPYTFNKTEAIESSSMVVVSANKEFKGGFLKNARLLFIDTHSNSSSYLDLEDPYYITNFSVNNPGKHKGQNFVVFTAKTDEWNDISKIKGQDPNSLFICNERGKGVQKISPENFDVKSWSINKESNSIIFVGTEDSNLNKKFEKNDKDKIYTFDLDKGGSIKEIHLPGSLAEKVESSDK